MRTAFITAEEPLISTATCSSTPPGASATAIHALSGQVNLNNYDGGAQALAVITTAKDEANGIYNNKAAVTANSHVNVFTKGANASAV